MSVSSLYGDDMVRSLTGWQNSRILMRLYCSKQAYIAAGTTLSFISTKEYRKLLCWLEQPNHHLIPADSEFYPLNFWRRQITPAHCLLKENCSAAFISACRSGESGAFMVWRRWGRLFCETLAKRGVTITSGWRVESMVWRIKRPYR